MSNANNVFVLSHSNVGYDFGDGIKKIVTNPETLKYIKSYVDSITGYASDANYMSASFVSKSYFIKDNYAVFVEAYPKRDNRLFLEIKLTVEDMSSSIDFFPTKIPGEDVTAVFQKHTATMIANSMLLSLVSEKTKLYCLTNNDDRVINGLNSLLFSLPAHVLSRASCVEAIGQLPEIKASAFMCRCFSAADKAAFENEIKVNQNCIVIDLTGDTPFVKFNINRPTYAQTVISGLLKKQISAVNIFRNAANKFGAVDTVSKNEFFNAVSYYMLYSNPKAKQFIEEFCATSEEIKAIKEYLASRGDRLF